MPWHEAFAAHPNTSARKPERDWLNNVAASHEKTSLNRGHRYLGQSFMTQLIDTSNVNFIMDSLAHEARSS